MPGVKANTQDKSREKPKVGGGACDDEFTTPVEGQPVLFAKAGEAAIAFARKARLEAVGGIVEPRVQDATVAPAGVEAEGAFLLKNDHAGTGETAFEFPGDAEPDDAAADNKKVWIVHED